jgi:hypothetical protein
MRAVMYFVLITMFVIMGTYVSIYFDYWLTK